MTRKAFLLTLVAFTASAVFAGMSWVESTTVSEDEFARFASIVLDRLASIEEAIRGLGKSVR